VNVSLEGGCFVARGRAGGGVGTTTPEVDLSS